MSIDDFRYRMEMEEAGLVSIKGPMGFWPDVEDFVNKFNETHKPYIEAHSQAYNMQMVFYIPIDEDTGYRLGFINEYERPERNWKKEIEDAYNECVEKNNLKDESEGE